MIVRVNIATEAGGESYLVDTDDIQNDNVKNAIEYLVEKDNTEMGSKKFGDYITVVYGELIQDGYVVSNELNDIAINDDIPEASVITNL